MLLHASLMVALMLIFLLGLPCLNACNHLHIMHDVGIVHIAIRSIINLNPVSSFCGKGDGVSRHTLTRALGDDLEENSC